MDIWNCALGFMDSQVLLTAEELGVFNALDRGAKTVPELAREIALPEDSCARLMTTLCTLGLVRRMEDGRYANSEQASAQLVQGKPGYIGGMFRHLREDLYPLWRHLKQALRDGKAQWAHERPSQAPPHNDPEALRSFMEGMHAITYAAARELAAMADELRAWQTITDVGGGAGSFLIALAQKHAHLKGIVFDLPTVQPIAEDFITRYFLSDRLRFHPGDFFSDPIPEGADAYSLGFVLHDWDTEGGTYILNKIAEASRPGTRLIVGEYLLNYDRTGPHHVARMDLNMLVAARGRERSACEYAQWLKKTGFELRRTYMTSQGKTFMVAERL